MMRMASRRLHPDYAPDIIPNYMPEMRWNKYVDEAFRNNIPPETRNGAHVVVKVLPGGERYRIYLLDPRDESMRVKAVLERKCI
jgi:hypothetical protein